MDNTKEKTISFRCSQDEFQIIEAKAQDAKMKKSTYIVKKCTANGELITPQIKSALCKIQSIIAKAENKLTNSTTSLKEIDKEVNQLWQLLN